MPTCTITLNHYNRPEFSLIYPNMGSTDHNNDQQSCRLPSLPTHSLLRPQRPQRRQRPAARAQSITGFDISVLVSAVSVFYCLVY
jgi:hypothetical protein